MVCRRAISGRSDSIGRPRHSRVAGLVVAYGPAVGETECFGHLVGVGRVVEVEPRCMGQTQTQACSPKQAASKRVPSEQKAMICR